MSWINSLSWMHWLLIALLAIFIALLFVARRRAWTFGRFSLLAIVAAIIVVPFFWLICSAIKDRKVFNAYTFLPPVSLWRAQAAPKGTTYVRLDSLTPEERASVKKDDLVDSALNLGNFRTLFTDESTVQGPVNFWRYVLNSLFLASATTFIAMVFSSMGGYALAKYRFRGRTAVLTFMLASMTIPGVVLLVPNFNVIWRLGFMNTFLALIVPGAVSVFGIFLFRQAMLGVPDDLLDAGRIDGCGEFRIYLTVIMPLVRPMTGAFCLITFLGAWNSFLGPYTYLQSQGNLPLPIVLNQYVGIYQQEYGVFLAGTLLAIIPPAILFFALQREFISGLTSGAVKQ